LLNLNLQIHLIFLDLPFHGEFKIFEKENIIENYLNYLNEKIQKPSIFIGWSLGASISVLFYLKYPEKVKKLVLTGFSPKFKDENLGHNPKFVKAFFISLKTDFENTVYNFRKLSSDNDFKEIPLPEKEGGIKILNEFVNLDLTKNLKDIKIETVLIHGKNDKVVNPHAAIYCAENIKNSKLILTNSNHSPFYQNPDIIVNHL
jgi:pimeloyl-[acyl-carrier protein] methyl ester esterase